MNKHLIKLLLDVFLAYAPNCLLSRNL